MILVTGGTGLVGSHLLLRLLKEGLPVRATYRKGSDLDKVKKTFAHYGQNAASLFKKIEWTEADINDIPALETAFLGIQQVYHAAALISFDPGDYKKLYRTNTRGTANIVNLCIHKKIKKLCHVSTIGAIGSSPKGKKADEENAWTPQDANVYALTKYAAEMEVWRASQEGVDVVIVNPGLIIGPGFWHSGSGAIFGIAKKGRRFYPPGGTGFVSVNDVVKIMAGLMASDIKNQRYVAVSENWTYKKALTEITGAMGLAPPNRKIRFWQLEVGRWLDRLSNIFFRTGRKITKNSIRSLKQREIYDNQKICRDLNFKFEPLPPVIRFCCEKFLEENP